MVGASFCYVFGCKSGYKSDRKRRKMAGKKPLSLFHPPQIFENMGSKGCCFVPGCRSGYNSDRKARKIAGRKQCSLFQAPHDDQLLEQWKKNIAREDKELTRRDRVCEYHFREEDIERFYVTKLSDGTLHKIERGRPFLNPDAVPTIFPRPTDQEHKSKRKRKCPKPQMVTKTQVVTKTPVVTKKTKLCTYSKTAPLETIVDLDPETQGDVLEPKEQSDGSESEEWCYSLDPNEHGGVSYPEEHHDAADLEEQDDGFDRIHNFESFSNKVESIELPDQWWGVKQTPRYVVFIRWNDDYVHEKRIVIDEDLNATVFVKGLQVGSERVISSMNEVSQLLLEVDKYQICAGIDIESMENCLGYVCKGKRGRTPIWCEKCRVRRKSKVEVMRQQFVRIQKEAANNNLEPIRYSRTTFSRLKDEISSLRNTMEKMEKECEEAANEADH